MRMIDLDPEELARLKAKPEPIAHDDPTASCTAVGWAKELEARGGDALSHYEPDVPNGRHWLARLVSDDPNVLKVIDIEAERWVDARAFAVCVAGGREVTVEPSSVPSANRWQVKFAGSALDPRNGLHMVARTLFGGGKFRPVRELKFE